MNKNISQHVLEKITQQEVKQTPRHVFLLKKGVVFSLSIITTMVGCAAMAVVFYLLNTEDRDVYHQIADNGLSLIFLTLPHIWLWLFLLFAAVLAYNIKHSERGYRFRLRYILFAYLGVSMLLGALVYALGFGRIIENTISTQVPFIERLPGGRATIWNQAERGLLGGKIQHLGTTEFAIIDPTGQVWGIRTNSTTHYFVSELRVGMRVKIIGEMRPELTDALPYFYATEIRPWFPKKDVQEKIREHQRPVHPIPQR